MAQRTREEIEKHARQNAHSYSEFTTWDAILLLEVLLDIRELLQHPPIEVSGECLACWQSTSGLCNEHETAMEKRFYAEVKKERDPLFEKAVAFIKKFYRAGDVIVPALLHAEFNCTFSDASALFEQLQEAGIISRPERGKAAKVL